MIGKPRLVYRFQWQEMQDLEVFVDTDFAGCIETRKYTAGGCVMLGTRLVKHWNSTQKVIALSSGEAELSGILKGSCEGLGVQSVMLDLGEQRDLSIKADSAAAIGICRRLGLGKVRHLAVGQLWVQQRLRAGDFKLFKFPGSCNQGDLLTKHVTKEEIERHTGSCHLAAQEGRAATATGMN